jgi:hypothetical protein
MCARPEVKRELRVNISGRQLGFLTRRVRRDGSQRLQGGLDAAAFELEEADDLSKGRMNKLDRSATDSIHSSLLPALSRGSTDMIRVDQRELFPVSALRFQLLQLLGSEITQVRQVQRSRRG